MTGLHKTLIAVLGVPAVLMLVGCAKAPPETREVDVLSALVWSLGIPKGLLELMSYPSKCATAKRAAAEGVL